MDNIYFFKIPGMPHISKQSRFWCLRYSYNHCSVQHTGGIRNASNIEKHERIASTPSCLRQKNFPQWLVQSVCWLTRTTHPTDTPVNSGLDPLGHGTRERKTSLFFSNVKRPLPRATSRPSYKYTMKCNERNFTYSLLFFEKN